MTNKYSDRNCSEFINLQDKKGETALMKLCKHKIVKRDPNLGPAMSAGKLVMSKEEEERWKVAEEAKKREEQRVLEAAKRDELDTESEAEQYEMEVSSIGDCSITDSSEDESERGSATGDSKVGSATDGQNPDDLLKEGTSAETSALTGESAEMSEKKPSTELSQEDSTENAHNKSSDSGTGEEGGGSSSSGHEKSQDSSSTEKSKDRKDSSPNSKSVKSKTKSKDSNSPGGKGGKSNSKDRPGTAGTKTSSKERPGTVDSAATGASSMATGESADGTAEGNGEGGDGDDEKEHDPFALTEAELKEKERQARYDKMFSPLEKKVYLAEKFLRQEKRKDAKKVRLKAEKLEKKKAAAKAMAVQSFTTAMLVGKAKKKFLAKKGNVGEGSGDGFSDTMHKLIDSGCRGEITEMDIVL